MKPAPFDYHRPGTVREASEILAAYPEEAKIIAGGQSLVPLMNFRLARPEHLVDINGIRGLGGYRIDGAGPGTARAGSGPLLRIGALTRHAELERNQVPGPLGRLLAAAGAAVGHLPIRTRGTFGGSIAHADPVAEWCLLATLLDAEITLQRADTTRTVAAGDLFVTVFTTVMEPDEVLVEVALPLLGAEHRAGVAEFARRAGDFAIVAAMVDVAVDAGQITAARVCLGGVADRPLRSPEAERALVGEPAQAAVFGRAGEAAAAAVDPPEDLHGDSEFRRDLVRTLVRRALEGAT